jgi:hypothetical protein
MAEGKLLSDQERAQLFVEKIEAAMCGTGTCHAKTFHVACVLVQGFGLSKAAAEPILKGWIQRGTHKWSENEIAHKLRCAEKAPGLQTNKGLRPHGCLRDEGAHDAGVGRPIRNDAPAPETIAPQAKVEFDPEKLRSMAGAWRDVVNLVWLANRSLQDPAQVSSAGFLQSMYRPGEKIVCFTNQQSQGQAIWPAERLPASSPDGVWFLAQPVDGNYHPNPRSEDAKTGEPKMSRRSLESVTAFRYMLLESDRADMRDWLGLLVQIPLRIEAIYTSGGRSIHALVRVDCPTKGAWDDEKRALEPTLRLLGICGADLRALTAVRLTRLPGAMRKGRLQKLLYLRPGAPLRPLMDIPAGRDVECFWCEMAALGVGDSDEGAGLEWMRRGLGYYANVSERVRAAAEAFEQKIAEVNA